VRKKGPEKKKRGGGSNECSSCRGDRKGTGAASYMGGIVPSPITLREIKKDSYPIRLETGEVDDLRKELVLKTSLRYKPGRSD